MFLGIDYLKADSNYHRDIILAMFMNEPFPK